MQRRAGPDFGGAEDIGGEIERQAEKLTSGLLEPPRWRVQSAPPTLSWMRASTVSVSGTRSSASARDMRARPSSVSRPNSPRKFLDETGAPLGADGGDERRGGRTDLAAMGGLEPGLDNEVADEPGLIGIEAVAESEAGSVEFGHGGHLEDRGMMPKTTQVE